MSCDQIMKYPRMYIILEDYYSQIHLLANHPHV